MVLIFLLNIQQDRYGLGAITADNLQMSFETSISFLQMRARQEEIGREKLCHWLQSKRGESCKLPGQTGRLSRNEVDNNSVHTTSDCV